MSRYKIFRQKWKSAEDYYAACTFKWKCVHCGGILLTPPPRQFDEDDYDDPPIHCKDYMEPLEKE